MTFITALRQDRVEAPWVIDGPINTQAFRVYVETELNKTLKPGDIVILDNPGSHKGQAIRDILRLLAQGGSSPRERQFCSGYHPLIENGVTEAIKLRRPAAGFRGCLTGFLDQLLLLD